MSYLRIPVYVWSDIHCTHLWLREADVFEDEWVTSCEFPRGIRVPNSLFDALALMRVAEIEANGHRKRAERAALKKYSGNTGSVELHRRVHGCLPEWVKGSGALHSA